MAIPEDLSWLPKYPTYWVRAIVLVASYQPFYAGASFPSGSGTGTGPQIGATQVWAGRQIQYQSISTIARPPLLVPSSWKGWYPDYIARRALHAASLQHFTFAGAASLPAATVPELAWKAVYPDWIARLLRPVPLQAHVPSVPAITLTSFPRYPDQISRDRLHVSRQAAWFFEGRAVIPPPEHSWRAQYPDQVSPLVGLRAASQTAFTFHPEPIAGAVPLSTTWRPAYPDVTEPRRGLRTDLAQSFAINLDPIPNPAPPAQLSWVVRYPDWHPTRVSPDGTVIRVEVPGPAVPFDLRWAPTYPDALRPRPFTATGFFIAPRIDDLPPIIPFLSATAYYPDFWTSVPVSRQHDPFVGRSTVVPMISPECIEWLDQDLTLAAFIAEDLSVPIFSRESGTEGEFLEEGCS